MENVLRVFPASNWPIVQRTAMGILFADMLLVVQQSGWSLTAIIMLTLSARCCWSIYRIVEQLSLRATTDRERADANWLLLELVVAMVAVLSLCILFLRAKHIHL